MPQEELDSSELDSGGLFDLFVDRFKERHGDKVMYVRRAGTECDPHPEQAIAYSKFLWATISRASGFPGKADLYNGHRASEEGALGLIPGTFGSLSSAEFPCCGVSGQGLAVNALGATLGDVLFLEFANPLPYFLWSHASRGSGEGPDGGRGRADRRRLRCGRASDFLKSEGMMESMAFLGAFASYCEDQPQDWMECLHGAAAISFKGIGGREGGGGGDIDALLSYRTTCDRAYPTRRSRLLVVLEFKSLPRVGYEGMMTEGEEYDDRVKEELKGKLSKIYGIKKHDTLNKLIERMSNCVEKNFSNSEIGITEVGTERMESPIRLERASFDVKIEHGVPRRFALALVPVFVWQGEMDLEEERPYFEDDLELSPEEGFEDLWVVRDYSTGGDGVVLSTGLKGIAALLKLVTDRGFVGALNPSE